MSRIGPEQAARFRYGPGPRTPERIARQRRRWAAGGVLSAVPGIVALVPALNPDWTPWHLLGAAVFLVPPAVAGGWLLRRWWRRRARPR